MNEIPGEFDDLLGFGSIVRLVKVGTHTIEMHTLSYAEAEAITDSMPPEYKTLNRIQAKILANSIVSVDGKVLSMESKIKLINSAQVGLVGLLAAEYEKMMVEQTAAYESVKKNSSIEDTSKI